MTPPVTIVVPVKDRRERMLRCLEALLDLDYPAYDVLVLDNGSTDGTPEACRERAQDAGVPVRVEVMGGTAGYRRNVGARISDSEIVAYTDSDCLPTPTWLSEGVQPFRDPGVGVVTGTTLPEDGPPYRPWHASVAVTEQTWRFETCNAFFRREPLVAAGGFDEEVDMWEDTRAGWAMLRAGWRARFAPAALVHHDVTYPGYRWHLARARRTGHLAAILRQFPEIRRTLLWGRYFLLPRHAQLVAAVVGMLLAPLTRRALVLAAPYGLLLATTAKPHGRPLPLALAGQSKICLRDLNGLYGMLRGSLRWRTLVL